MTDRHTDDHNDNPPRRWLWLLPALTFTLGAIGMGLFLGNRDVPVAASWGAAGGARDDFVAGLNSFQQAVILPAVAGVFSVLILRQQPRHRIGWLLMGLSLLTALSVLFAEWGVRSALSEHGPVPGGSVAAWIANWLWVVLMALVVLMVGLFPSGTFLSPRWRALSLATILLLLVAGVLAGAIETPMSSAFQIDNPFVANHRPRLYDALFFCIIVSMVASTLVNLTQTAVRYRRGRGVERAQIKWLLAGVGLFAIMLIAGGVPAVLSLLGGANASTPSAAFYGALGASMVNAAPLAVLVGIGIAMVRHQLYDIDFLIRRTTSYAILTGLLALIYGGSVLLLQALLSPVRSDSAIAVVPSTLLIAALFLPVRRRVQNLIDRRFYRQKYDAQETLAQFAQKARDETNLDALTDELVRVIQETMQPEHVTVWLRPTAEGSAIDSGRQTPD